MANVELCGKFDEVVSSFWDRLKELFGLLVIYSIIDAGIKAYGVPEILKSVVTFLGKLGITVSGFTVAAIAIAVLVSYILWANWVSDCVADPDGDEQCFTGVVGAINEEELGALLFPKHPSLDLVVRSAYLQVIIAFSPAMIYCTDARGTLVKIVFKSSRVCGIRLGNAIGGTVGAVGGAIAGAVAGAALAGALGCAAATVFYILCLLVVLLVVAVIVIAAAAAGAVIGGAIAAAATDENSPTLSDGSSIAIGDLLSAQGTTAKNNNYEGSVAQYFNKCTSLIGRASRPGPFTNGDVDEFVSDAADSCRLTC